MTPAVCLAIWGGYPTLALSGLVYAAVTDFLDGYLARKWGQQTSLGAKLDPLADKVLVAGVGVTLTLLGYLPAYVLYVMVFRDIALVLGYMGIRWQHMEPPKSFRALLVTSPGGGDVEVQATMYSKINTVLQFTLLVLALVAWYLGDGLPWYVSVLSAVVAVTTVGTGIHYGITRAGVRIR